ncbi:MAG TPA: Na+/H+ antiporter [Methylomirabilota bacterium]|nr:Na+/H+ antiporter [Methylomirabilota bacterium]
MATLHQLQTVVLLLIAVLVLVTLAQRVLIPYPILLVLGGLALSLVPGVPVVPLQPDLVFFIFLPPILWAAAYFTSLRDFRANLRPITLLAVGLVLATTAAVAAVARLILPGLSWPAAFALGAIVSPPDAVATTAIARRLHIPHRLVTILEGESLINDATALVLYRVAVAAVVTGSFVLGETPWLLVATALGGTAIGLVVGAVARRALRLTADSLAETAVTLLAPYAAWVLAERMHTSAVLACVVGGLYLRQGFSEVVAPATRLQARAVWDLLVFVLNGVIFILIGLQLAAIREAAPPGTLAPLLVKGAVISATAIAVRLVWVPLAAVIPRLLSPSLRRRDPMPPWQALFLLGWAGMRGIVSLAAALALPLTTASGAPFPFRDEITVLSFVVILSTLVVQGLSLPRLIRVLNLGEDATLELEEVQAREAAARAALARLDEVTGAPWARAAQVDRLRAIYTQRLRRSSPLTAGQDRMAAEGQASYRRLRHETLSAERRAVIALRDQGAISDEVLHRIEQELDVEATRIGLGEARLETEA